MQFLLTEFGRGGAHFLIGLSTFLLSFAHRDTIPCGRWHQQVVENDGITWFSS